MAETSHEIRHDIELTRERVGSTIAALERKVNPRYVLDDHPLAAVGVAFGTGVLLATTGAAARAAHEVKDQLSEGATNVNARAGSALDGVLRSILNAASAAIATKLSDVLEGAVSGVAPQRRVAALAAPATVPATSVRAA
ncbi:MAG TPA: DUF3618 domain-containing protein [Candidatus Elarobacter sp.]|nr:DUF3618 domain-containing protein [Candidatus Elarobacter sp.]